MSLNYKYIAYVKQRAVGSCNSSQKTMCSLVSKRRRRKKREIAFTFGPELQRKFRMFTKAKYKSCSTLVTLYYKLYWLLYISF